MMSTNDQIQDIPIVENIDLNNVIEIGSGESASVWEVHSESEKFALKVFDRSDLNYDMEVAAMRSLNG